MEVFYAKDLRQLLSGRKRRVLYAEKSSCERWQQGGVRCLYLPHQAGGGVGGSCAAWAPGGGRRREADGVGAAVRRIPAAEE